MINFKIHISKKNYKLNFKKINYYVRNYFVLYNLQEYKEKL